MFTTYISYGILSFRVSAVNTCFKAWQWFQASNKNWVKTRGRKGLGGIAMEWECQKCTLINDPDALECKACGAPRPDMDLQDLGFDGGRGSFLPPTAGGPGSSVLPPMGTQDFSSGTLPPQGTLSPNALADLMPSPQSTHPPPQKTPHAGHVAGTSDMFGAMQSYDRSYDQRGLGGYGDYGDGYDGAKGKKLKKSKKEKDRSDRGNELAQDSPQRRQSQDRRTSPNEDIPTYVPTAGHSGTAFHGTLAGGRLVLRILRAYDLRNTDLGILPSDASDPFAVARIGSKDFKTHVVENSLNLNTWIDLFQSFQTLFIFFDGPFKNVD